MVRRSPKPGSEVVTFADLSDREAAFVREYVERGAKQGDATEAVLAAGITTNRNAARVRAYEMLHKPKVLQLLRDELTRKLNAGAALGVAVLVDLAQSARSEQVRFSAAKELVDRGHGPVMSRNATITATTTVEDLLKRLDEAEASGALGATEATDSFGRGAAHVIDVTPRVVDSGDGSNDGDDFGA